MRCEECHAAPTGAARGWIGLRVDEPGDGEPPTLAFYCLACSQREFGGRFAKRFAEPS
jgi:hypothetical protein